MADQRVHRLGQTNPVFVYRLMTAGTIEVAPLAMPKPPAGDLDYLGLNYYRRDSVGARSDRPFDWEIGAVPGSEQTQMLLQPGDTVIVP